MTCPRRLYSTTLTPLAVLFAFFVFGSGPRAREATPPAQTTPAPQAAPPARPQDVKLRFVAYDSNGRLAGGLKEEDLHV
ncbi:MAG TPA: hypothetical protein VM936_00105 [Pyrinomonadaceae bacterium]|jgi:hypothetical protein|nr:hypothetical protein [Pyrinomonadaceae bacterium]